MNARDTMFALVAACALVACSGDDDTTEPTTVATESTPDTRIATTAANTTSPTTTSALNTTPPTTAAATTQVTSPPTPASLPTTSPTPTSSGPLDEAEAIAAIIEAAEGAWRTSEAAFIDPFNDQAVAAMAEFRTEEQFRAILAVVERYRSENTRIVPRPGDPSVLRVDPLTAVLDIEDGYATIIGCAHYSSVKVATGAASDGSDVVVDDEIVDRAEQYELARVDGRWLVSGASLAAEGTLSCG